MYKHAIVVLGCGIDAAGKLNPDAELSVRLAIRALDDHDDTCLIMTGNVSYKPQTVKDRDLLVYGISMSVGGSYAAIKSFLGDLQKNSELLVIESISLSKSDLYEENVIMDLHLTVYLQGKEGV